MTIQRTFDSIAKNVIGALGDGVEARIEGEDFLVITIQAPGISRRSVNQVVREAGGDDIWYSVQLRESLYLERAWKVARWIYSLSGGSPIRVAVPSDLDPPLWVSLPGNWGDTITLLKGNRPVLRGAVRQVSGEIAIRSIESRRTETQTDGGSCDAIVR